MAMNRAWALVQAGTTPTVIVGKRIASVARNGAGDYSVNFTEDNVMNGTSYGLLATPMGTSAALIHIDAAAVSDRQARVRTTTEGSLADSDFSLEVIGHQPGNP